MYQIFTLLETVRPHVVPEEESGQGLAEYALILALICVVAIAAITGLGAAIVTKLGQITNAF